MDSPCPATKIYLLPQILLYSLLWNFSFCDIFILPLCSPLCIHPTTDFAHGEFALRPNQEKNRAWFTQRHLLKPWLLPGWKYQRNCVWLVVENLFQQMFEDCCKLVYESNSWRREFSTKESWILGHRQRCVSAVCAAFTPPAKNSLCSYWFYNKNIIGAIGFPASRHEPSSAAMQEEPVTPNSYSPWYNIPALLWEGQDRGMSAKGKRKKAILCNSQNWPLLKTGD